MVLVRNDGNWVRESNGTEGRFGLRKSSVGETFPSSFVFPVAFHLESVGTRKDFMKVSSYKLDWLDRVMEMMIHSWW